LPLTTPFLDAILTKEGTANSLQDNRTRLRLSSSLKLNSIYNLSSPARQCHAGRNLVDQPELCEAETSCSKQEGFKAWMLHKWDKSHKCGLDAQKGIKVVDIDRAGRVMWLKQPEALGRMVFQRLDKAFAI